MPPLKDPRAARDINRIVERVLRDISNDKPRVRLKEVRDLLKLDRKYYTSTETGLLNEVVHRLRMGGRDLVRRTPALLSNLVQRLKLEALLFPDRRRIMIDKELPDPRRRWAEGHEIGHSLIPWHDKAMLGDRRQTLTPTCHYEMEAQANYAAGRLLFRGDEFRERLRSSPITIGHVHELSRMYGNSVASTLWRTVENMDGLGFALITRGDDGGATLRHFLVSEQFAAQFAGTSGGVVLALAESWLHARERVPITLCDDSGRQHVFEIESMNNTYDILPIGVHVGKRPTVVAA